VQIESPKMKRKKSIYPCITSVDVKQVYEMCQLCSRVSEINKTSINMST